MVNLSRANPFPVEFGESLAVGHVAVEDSTHFASLSVAEHPNVSSILEEEIYFF